MHTFTHSNIEGWIIITVILFMLHSTFDFRILSMGYCVVDSVVVLESRLCAKLKYEILFRKIAEFDIPKMYYEIFY